MDFIKPSLGSYTHNYKSKNQFGVDIALPRQRSDQSCRRWSCQSFVLRYNIWKSKYLSCLFTGTKIVTVYGKS